MHQSKPCDLLVQVQFGGVEEDELHLDDAQQHPGDRRRKVIRALELSFHYTAKDFNNDQMPMGTEIVSTGY